MPDGKKNVSKQQLKKAILDWQMPVNTDTSASKKKDKTKQSYTNLKVKETRGMNNFICQMVKKIC